MSDRWGATYAEWTHWANTLGLRANLLPVVCRPGCSIASNSKLTEYGKVPCLYTLRGHVSGIAKWTSKQATVPEVRAWREQPDYGICLQTRRWRALDVDVEDPAVAETIRTTICEHWPDRTIYFRTRPDSSKFLVLFDFGSPAPLGKRTMRVPGGMLEFLADGQQCLVAGTHPKGARYVWATDEGYGLADDEGPEAIETTLDQFNECWHAFDDLLALEPPTESRPKSIRGVDRESQSPDSTGSDRAVQGHLAPIPPLADSVAALLVAQGLYNGETNDGRVYFTCPWKDSHTKASDVTETVYFKAGTGGFDRGHFSCLHAHCASRTDADFLDAIGWTLQGFDDVPGGDGPVESGSDDPDARATLDAFGLDPDARPLRVLGGPDEAPPLAVVGRNIKTGIIPATSQNLVAALERDDLTGLVIRQDLFTGRLLIGPSADQLAPIKDHDYTDIGLILSRLMFDPKLYRQTLRDAVRLVGFRKAFDSGLNWAASLPEWDGVSRVETFYPTYLGTEDTPYTRSVGLYMWTAMAGRLLEPGIQADMAPVWIGPQGSGKTSAVRSLVVSDDHYVEINLSDDHKDLARTMAGKLVGELSELRGIRGRDLEWTKAFITRRVEEWIPKFQEERTSYPRRILFIGTSNREDFLVDPTGNRRWLPVQVGEVQDIEGIVRDREQLWSEAVALFVEGGIRWAAAQKNARGEHHQYAVGDIWEEPVLRYLFDEGVDGVAPIQKSWITTWEVLRDGLHHDSKQASQFAAIRVAGILRRLGFIEQHVRQNKKQFRAWVQDLF